MTTQAPGYYRTAIGDIVLTSLIDGYTTLPLEYHVGIDPDKAQKLHAASRRESPPRCTTTVFLLEIGDHRVLIDTGNGAFEGPEAGLLIDSLAAAGFAPDDVSMICITHIHADHIGGLVDTDGEVVFRNAEILVHEAEVDFWLGDEPVGASDSVKWQRSIIKLVMPLYLERLHKFKANDEILPGLSVVHEPGHTPGHCGFRVTSKGATILIWGDIVHHPHIQTADPKAGFRFDVDYGQAVSTREALFEEVAESGLCVAGSHLDFPAIGHVVRNGDAFAFLPRPWKPVV